MSYARCPKCNTLSLVVSVTDAPLEPVCGSCGALPKILAFPALESDGAAKPPPLVDDPPDEGEANCFYSPGRRATKECSHCGVLISDPWAAAWGSQTVCLKCLDQLRADVSNKNFQTHRMLWDNVVLGLALAPLTIVLWWAVFMTAPAALFLGFWHWNSPRSIIPRGKARIVIGMLLAAVQLAAIIFLIVLGGSAALGI